MKNKIFTHKSRISQIQREKKFNHKPKCLWLTGLSGAGKSTIAFALEERLFFEGFFPCVLDGDNLRSGINKDLGFTEKDRAENVRRVSEIAKIMVDSGLIVIVSLISPFIQGRNQARSLFSYGEFYEIFIDASLSECTRRDPKDLYLNANQGLIENFTGLTSNYEAPLNPDMHIFTEKRNVNECVEDIMNKLIF